MMSSPLFLVVWYRLKCPVGINIVCYGFLRFEKSKINSCCARLSEFSKNPQRSRLSAVMSICVLRIPEFFPCDPIIRKFKFILFRIIRF